MFEVKRCVQDYEEVCKNVVAEFETESDAEHFADTENQSRTWDVWFEVVER